MLLTLLLLIGQASRALDCSLTFFGTSSRIAIVVLLISMQNRFRFCNRDVGISVLATPMCVSTVAAQMCKQSNKLCRDAPNRGSRVACWHTHQLHGSKLLLVFPKRLPNRREEHSTHVSIASDNP